VSTEWDRILVENERMHQALERLTREQAEKRSFIGERARVRCAIKALPSIPRAVGHIDGEDRAVSLKAVLRIVAGEEE
jgi:hypothetical protein